MKFSLLISCALLLACTANSDSSTPAPVNALVVQHRSEKSTAINDSLVTIESVYKDLNNNGKDVPVKGTGFLVQAGQQTFVVTASHVSQGDKLAIHYQGKDLTVKGRYYADEHDVEVIEVDGAPSAVAFSLDSRGIIEWKGQEIGRARWVDAFTFALLNDWVQDPNLSVDNTFAKQNFSTVACDFLCGLLEATTLMQPGSSGSPLVVKIPSATEWSGTGMPYDVREAIGQHDAGKYFLRGLTIRRDRFFARSSFVPVATLVQSIQAYQKGTRTAAKPGAAWNVAGSLLFRITDSDLYESAAVSGSSGNGVSMDGGNIGDLNEENPHDVLSKLSALPVRGGEAQSFWMMMMRHPTTGAMMSAPLWFDMEHYLGMRRFTMSLAPEPQDKDNILSFFLMRFGRKGHPTEFLNDDKTSKVTFPQTGFVQVETRTSDGATLSFLLNSKAAYCKDQNTCESTFMAVIEVPASNGAIYFVDLRGFLFVNPIATRSDAFHDANLAKLSDQDWYKFTFDDLGKELQTVRLSYRRKRTVQTPLTVQEGQVSEKIWTIQ